MPSSVRISLKRNIYIIYAMLNNGNYPFVSKNELESWRKKPDNDKNLIKEIVFGRIQKIKDDTKSFEENIKEKTPSEFSGIIINCLKWDKEDRKSAEDLLKSWPI